MPISTSTRWTMPGTGRTKSYMPIRSTKKNRNRHPRRTPVMTSTTSIAPPIATAARIIRLAAAPAARPVAAAVHPLETAAIKVQARLHRLRHLPRLRHPQRSRLQRKPAPALRRTAIQLRAICFTTNTAISSLLPSRRATAKPSIW